MVPGRRRGMVVVLIVLILACGREPAAPQVSARARGWKSDLQLLSGELTRRHPPSTSDPGFTRFHAAIAKLDAAVESLSDEAMVIGVQRALATVGDGHTIIIPIPLPTLAFGTVPVDFYWFDDGVYVVGASPEHQSLVGARVTDIGGVPVASLMDSIATIVSSDNAWSARWLGAQLMSYTAVLRASGAGAPDQETTLRLVDASGASRVVTLAAGSRQPVGRLLPYRGETATTPRYLRNADKPFWLDSLPAQGALYVGFNAVRNASDETLAAFAARVGALLQLGRFTTVIVDARLNNGGDNRLLAPIVQGLAAFSNASPVNRLYTIVGRSTFSAAQNFVNQLERSARVTFVGEPTGSRPNFAGDDSDIPLPYSQLHVSIASRYYMDSSPTDTRPTITPHITVPVRASDYFANRDPALDAVLQAISPVR